MKKIKSKKPVTYNEDSIRTLTPIEHVRLNPAMYLGSADGDGAYHGAREIIDNSMDEALGGHAKRITVTMDEDRRGLTVEDDGRGIPHGKSKDSGISVLATAFGSAFTGGKFKGLKEGYSTSVGVHGIGSKATNYTSELFEAWSYRGDGKCAYVKFNYGLMPKGMKDAEIKPTKHKGTGTRVHFRPDYENVFKGAGPFDVKRFRFRLQELSFLLPGVTMAFVDKPKGKEKLFKSQESLAGLIAWRAGERKLVVEPWTVTALPVTVRAGDKEATAQIDVAVSWIDDLEAPVVDAYTNLGPNDEGGTHQKGVEKAISSAFLALAKDGCSTQEIFKGMRAAVHIRHPHPEFKGQTKNALVNKDVAEAVASALEKPLSKWIKKNKEWVTAFIEECKAAYAQRTMSKATRSALRDLLPRKGEEGLAPGKALEKPRCPPSEREIFIVEGDSASGTLKKIARANHFQEVLPLRGKVINAMRADVNKVLANKEFATIIRMIGGGLGDEFDLKKCRQARVLLAPDADPDGKHIESLLLGFFFMYMRPLIDDGRLYIVRSPLFRASPKRGDKRYYGDSLEEIRSKAGAEFSSLDITRLKGHGEASVADMKQYAADPSTRKLTRITADEKTMQRINAVMSDDVTARKSLLGLAD